VLQIYKGAPEGCKAWGGLKGADTRARLEGAITGGPGFYSGWNEIDDGGFKIFNNEYM
jgi:hypothetical protein